MLGNLRSSLLSMLDRAGDLKRNQERKLKRNQERNLERSLDRNEKRN
jgi:hypothetical protein